MTKPCGYLVGGDFVEKNRLSLFLYVERSVEAFLLNFKTILLSYFN